MVTNRSGDASPNQLCHCDSGKLFLDCCSIILKNHSLAQTPEELMRSRYTAYVLHDEAHLLTTWDETTRPESLSFNNALHWLYLHIDKNKTISTEADSDYVTFSAGYIHNGSLFAMQERSRFIRKNDLWYYQKGELHVEQKELSLNGPCPCGSQKKYKRCCHTIHVKKR